MIQDQKKPQVQNPSNSVGGGKLEIKDRSKEAPQVEDVIDEIDRLLEKTQAPAILRLCGC